MRKVLSIGIIALGVLFDQLFKHWIVASIPENGLRPFIPGLLSLTHLTNSGAAWSSLEGQQWLFLILTPIVIVIVIAAFYLWRKIRQNWYLVGLSLIIAGALGNFIDRLHQGFVVDMLQLDFINFPIFNIADSLLSVGFVCLFIAILRDKN